MSPFSFSCSRPCCEAACHSLSVSCHHAIIGQDAEAWANSDIAKIHQIPDFATFLSKKKHPAGCLSLVFHEFHSANQIVFDRLVGCCVTENEIQHGLTWFQHGFMVIESSTFHHRRLVLIELSTLKRKLMPIIVPSQKLFSEPQ